MTATFEVWVDGRGTDDRTVRRTVRSAQKQRPARVLVVGGQDWRGFEQSLAGVRAPYLVWLDAGAELEAGALTRIGQVLTRFPADLLYGDDVQNLSGRRTAIRRPDFSPERLLGQDYLGEIRVFDVEEVRRVGGVADVEPGLTAWELALRLEPRQPVHVPDVLARRHQPRRPPDGDASSAMITGELARRGRAAHVVRDVDRVRIIDDIVGDPLVSIVIPTRGSSAVIGGKTVELVTEAVRGIVERSTYRRFEIVVVVDDATPPLVVEHLKQVGGPSLELVPWSAPFNFSAKVNRGVAHARGDYVLLLNDDIQIISPDWIEAMLGLAQQQGIGLVGAALLFEDGTVQHGGHFYEVEGAGHVAFTWRESDDDALASMSVVREVSGVTAACALISREMYLRVGGLSALLPANYNDVDFCLKIRSLGERIVWTPFARLSHYESKTREPTTAIVELETLRRRWRSRIQIDGYWPSGPSRLGRGPRPVRSHPAR